MNKEELLKEREIWYNTIAVKYEIAKCLKNRELTFLASKNEEQQNKRTRYLIGWSVKYLDKHFTWFNFYKYLVNMYHSVSLFKEGSIPIFSYNLSLKRKEPKYDEFNDNYEKYVSGYNLFIDIDGKEDFETAYKDLKSVKKIFDEYKLPYYVVNSSFNGFHIVIPQNYMPKIEINELINTIRDVIYNFSGIYGFKSIDTSITDLKRICKVPYSYECYGAICLPLTDEQIEEYTFNMVKMKNVLSQNIIRDRGLLIRKHGLTDEELKEKVIKFIEDFK
jgi:hypothetical protein